MLLCAICFSKRPEIKPLVRVGRKERECFDDDNGQIIEKWTYKAEGGTKKTYGNIIHEEKGQS